MATEDPNHRFHTEYTRDPSSKEYICRVRGEEQFRTREVAIYFSDDGEEATLHKHGRPELVNQAAAAARAAYLKAGWQAMADEVSVISSTQWDLQELNMIINSSGYLTIFLRAAGLREGEQRAALAS